MYDSLPARVRASLDSPIALALLAARRTSAQRLGLVLLYHRIGDEQGGLVPAVRAGALVREMRWLKPFFRIVPAREILAASRARRRFARIPLAVTFDDDAPSQVTHALPALRRGRVRATFFLTGAGLHDQMLSPFWWEQLEAAGVPGRADELKHMTPAARERARAALGVAVRPVEFGADSVRSVAAEHDVGFHTLHHHHLPDTDDEELHAAMRQGRVELEQASGHRIDLIAYPHGGADERIAAAAREAGFTLGFTTHAERVTPDTDPLLIGRVEPGPVSLGSFLRQLEWALRGRGD